MLSKRKEKENSRVLILKEKRKVASTLILPAYFQPASAFASLARSSNGRLRRL